MCGIRGLTVDVDTVLARLVDASMLQATFTGADQTRYRMLETLRQDYVTTARAKGLPERDVIYKHARPNAMISVVTLAGFTVVGLMGGVVITETVFDYPGIGKAAAQAAAWPE